MSIENSPVDSPPSDEPSSAVRRSPAWAGRVGKVVYNLAVHRARLRRAARYAADPEMAERLRRLARRRKGDAKELVRAAPPDVLAAQPIPPQAVAPHAVRQLALANEIASVAAALRSNRKVRVAIERAATKNPPAAVAAKLARTAADLEIEADTLNRHLRDVAVVEMS